jgi:hypothetical protein
MLQNIIPTLAGLDHQSRAPTGTMGALFEGLLRVTRVAPKPQILIAFLRPADWSSYNPREPLTWCVLGGWELAIGRVESVNGECMNVKMVKFVSLGTDTPSVVQAVPWPAENEVVQVLKPVGNYLVPREQVRQEALFNIPSIESEVDSSEDLWKMFAPPSAPSPSSGNSSAPSAFAPQAQPRFDGGMGFMGRTGDMAGQSGGAHSQSAQFLASTSNSVAMLPDPLGMLMYHNKNEVQQMTVQRSVPLRLYMGGDRLKRATGNFAPK